MVSVPPAVQVVRCQAQAPGVPGRRVGGGIGHRPDRLVGCGAVEPRGGALGAGRDQHNDAVGGLAKAPGGRDRSNGRDAPTGSAAGPGAEDEGGAEGALPCVACVRGATRDALARACANPSIHLTLVPPWHRLWRKGMWTPRPWYSCLASVVTAFELLNQCACP